MNFVFNENIIQDMAKEQITIGLERVGIFLTGEVIDRVPVDSGALRDSIDYEVEEEVCYIYANIEYAAIQEYGGEIVPLKIVGSVSRKKIVYAMEQYFWAKFYETNDEKYKRMALHVASGKTIHIPAQPYLGPALYENSDRIVEVFCGSN